MELLNLYQLQAFADVVELGSFSAAAKRRNLTQPALSLRVKELERQLGVTLVERAGRRLRITPAGAVLHSHIAQINTAVNQAVGALADYRSEADGRIAIAAGPSICSYLLPPLLGTLKRVHPQLEIAVRAGTIAEIVDWIDDGSVDLAIVTSPSPGRLREITPILNDELVAIFMREDPARPTTFTPKALASRPLIFPERGGGSRPLIEAWFAKAGHSVKPIMEVSSIEAIKHLVGAGFGYAIVPRLAVAGAARLSGISFASLVPRTHRTLALVVRQERRISRGFKEVVAAITRLEAVR